MYLVGVIFLLFFVTSSSAQSPMSWFLNDPRWKSAHCLFRIPSIFGMFENNPKILTLEGCLANAQFRVMSMANRSKDEKEERAYHKQTTVDFVDRVGRRWTCQLDSRKRPFDRVPDIIDFDQLPVGMKDLLEENFSVSCVGEMSAVANIHFHS